LVGDYVGCVVAVVADFVGVVYIVGVTGVNVDNVG